MASLSPAPFLEGQRVILRPLALADLEGDYPAWLNDPEVSAYNGHHTYPYSIPAARAYIEGAQDFKKNVILAIVAKDTGKHIGNISLQNVDYVSRNAEYAIMLGDRAYWGKGIANEASQLLLAHGFTSLNLHRIYCGTSDANEPMQKLAVALGFVQEGIRREAFFKNGAYMDVIEYGLLARDFALNT